MHQVIKGGETDDSRALPKDPFNFIICGVGGQGNILVSEMFASALIPSRSIKRISSFIALSGALAVAPTVFVANLQLLQNGYASQAAASS